MKYLFFRKTTDRTRGWYACLRSVNSILVHFLIRLVSDRCVSVRIKASVQNEEFFAFSGWDENFETLHYINQTFFADIHSQTSLNVLLIFISSFPFSKRLIDFTISTNNWSILLYFYYPGWSGAHEFWAKQCFRSSSLRDGFVRILPECRMGHS